MTTNDTTAANTAAEPGTARRRAGWPPARSPPPADHCQLAAVPDHAQGTPGWAAALVHATTPPVLIADVSDSDAALLVADSPGGHRWSALQRSGR
jgi:hypothetical protein